jgi:hypothetical protein
MSFKEFATKKLNEEGVTGYNITRSAPLYAVLSSKLFPNGFTADTTKLSQKEVLDAVLVVKEGNVDEIAQFIDSIQDAIVACRKNEQMNKAADLEIRLFIARTALGFADVWGKYAAK